MELETYFPENFISSKEKDIYDKIKIRTLYELEQIVNDVDKSKEIYEIDEILFKAYTPKIFIGNSSVEISHDKQFESACLLLAQRGNLDARNMTVLQFYSAFLNIKLQIETEAKQYKKIKKSKH